MLSKMCLAQLILWHPMAASLASPQPKLATLPHPALQLLRDLTQLFGASWPHLGSHLPSA